ncbi:MAG: hypothetical protein JWP48_2299 [Actinoallomurus sp.]|nr:hypothetical protein [Actinoallomurus sp.]
MGGEGLVDQLAALAREGDEDDTSIPGLRASLDEVHRLKPVEPVGHGGGGQHASVGQLRGGQPGLSATPTKRCEDVELATIDTESVEGHSQGALEETGQSQHPADDSLGGHVEIGSFDRPFVEDLIDVVGTLPGDLGVLGGALRWDFLTSNLLTSKYHVRTVPIYA